MSHTNKSIRLSAKIILLSFGLTLAACGGGGGGGTTYPSIQYSGDTDQATVDSTNAEDFPVTMLEGSTASAESNPYAAVIDSSSNQSSQHAAMLDIFVKQATNNILAKMSSTESNIVSAVTQTQPGTCLSNPGSLTITDNSTTTNINASITYDNFCVGNFDGTSGLNLTLHGKTSLVGNLLSADPLVIDSFNMSIEYLKMTVVTVDGTVSEEFSGFIAVTFDGSTSNNVTGMNVSTNFQANGVTYKVENLFTNKSGTTLYLSGRFYHPAHGYVDVTTTEPFDLYSTNPDKYCSGTMELTGNGGVIEFTANTGCTQYNVTFTATGNVSGTPDYDSGTVAWP